MNLFGKLKTVCDDSRINLTFNYLEPGLNIYAVFRP